MNEHEGTRKSLNADHVELNSHVPPFYRSGKRLKSIVIHIGSVGLIGALAAWIVMPSNSASDDLSLSSLATQMDAHQHAISQLNGRVNGLQASHDETGNRLSQLSKRFDGVEASHQDQSDQLGVLSKQLDDLSGSIEAKFGAVEDKVLGAEASIKDMRQTYISHKPQARRFTKHTHHTPATSSQPKLPVPPFTVLGVEVRGGRSYLSLAFGTAGQLSDLHLIGEGESVGVWQLTSIEGHSAIFTVEGKAVVVAVP